jgi:serine/threonine protein kinase
MSDLFNTLIKKYFKPHKYIISPLKNTSHWNVKRLYDKVSKSTYIVKGIINLDNDNEMGKKQMNKAYKTEIYILSILPKWWGLYLKNNFIKYPFRFIVTPELPSCKWSMYKGNNDIMIAKKIYKQIKWLHKHKIAHNDLELKNILLDCNMKNAIIIDFEKSTLNASSLLIKNDFITIINNLMRNKNTKGIAKQLKKLKKTQNHNTIKSRYIKNKKKTIKVNNLD